VYFIPSWIVEQERIQEFNPVSVKVKLADKPSPKKDQPIPQFIQVTQFQLANPFETPFRLDVTRDKHKKLLFLSGCGYKKDLAK